MRNSRLITVLMVLILASCTKSVQERRARNTEVITIDVRLDLSSDKVYENNKETGYYSTYHIQIGEEDGTGYPIYGFVYHIVDTEQNSDGFFDAMVDDKGAWQVYDFDGYYTNVTGGGKYKESKTEIRFKGMLTRQ